MTWTAYVDESEPSAGGTYILSCALVDVDDAVSTRATLAAAKPPEAKKLHWHDTLPEDQPALVELVAGLPSMHLIVVRDNCHDEPSERRRRKCLEQLLCRLDQEYGVREVVLESRHHRQNSRDLKIVNVLRSSQAVSSRLRVNHVPGPKEELLWIPDVVAGAFTVGRTVDLLVYAPLVQLVDVIDCSPEGDS